ncbi:MAG: hypothetical protein HY098_02365 [Nitrospinae bacterium]|nr:hypothetical protein [Nitrospinota bacterium]
MKIRVRRDGEGYLADVPGQPQLFAWAPTKARARMELLSVVEMMLDYHLEQVEMERKVRSKLAAV